MTRLCIAGASLQTDESAGMIRATNSLSCATTTHRLTRLSAAMMSSTHSGLMFRPAAVTMTLSLRPVTIKKPSGIEMPEIAGMPRS